MCLLRDFGEWAEWSEESKKPSRLLLRYLSGFSLLYYPKYMVLPFSYPFLIIYTFLSTLTYPAVQRTDRLIPSNKAFYSKLFQTNIAVRTPAPVALASGSFCYVPLSNKLTYRPLDGGHTALIIRRDPFK